MVSDRENIFRSKIFKFLNEIEKRSFDLFNQNAIYFIFKLFTSVVSKKNE